MTARFIPREEVSGCELWDLGAIGQSDARLKPGVHLPTAGEVQAMQDQAIAEGYAAGVAQVRAQAALLGAAVQKFEAARAAFEESAAEQVLALALDIAAQIVRTVVKVRPELLLPVVRDSIALLPAVQGEAQLHLNPLEAELVQTHLGDALEHGRWKIVADPSVPAGGCRIDSAAGKVDATLEKRWARLVAALGVEHAWVE